MNHGAMKQSVFLPFADSRVQHGYPGQQKYLGQARMSQFLQLCSIVGKGSGKHCRGSSHQYPSMLNFFIVNEGSGKHC